MKVNEIKLITLILIINSNYIHPKKELITLMIYDSGKRKTKF